MQQLVNKKEKAIVFLSNRENDSKKLLEKFKTQLTTNPIYAFEWADEKIEAAQMIELCKIARELVENQGVDALIEYLTKEVCRNAQWAEESTSPCSNYTKRMYLKVRAQLLDRLQNRLY